MRVDEVRDRVEHIRQLAAKGDDPKAHIDEDELYADVLRAIAAGGVADAPLLAAAALQTAQIEFSRWYE